MYPVLGFVVICTPRLYCMYCTLMLNKLGVALCAPRKFYRTPRTSPADPPYFPDWSLIWYIIIITERPLLICILYYNILYIKTDIYIFTHTTIHPHARINTRKHRSLKSINVGSEFRTFRPKKKNFQPIANCFRRPKIRVRVFFVRRGWLKKFWHLSIEIELLPAKQKKQKIPWLAQWYLSLHWLKITSRLSKFQENKTCFWSCNFQPMKQWSIVEHCMSDMPENTHTYTREPETSNDLIV